MQTGLRFADGWPKWVSALLVASCLLACDEKKSPEPAPGIEDRPLLDPEEPVRERSHRCKPTSGGQPVTVRANSTEKVPGAIEIGSAAAVPRGFVVGMLRTEGETSAALTFVDGKGALKTTSLSRVHGSVEAPRVVAMGADVIAVVPDNDAGHTRLRLAKVSDPHKDAKVSWGPEIQVRRGESQSHSLAISASSDGKRAASGVVVWDDFDKATLKSQIRALSFDPATLKATGAERALTSVEEDAVDPVVVGSSSSFWVAWLAYQSEAAPSSSPSGALVDEAPRALRVQKLDDRGQPEGEPLTLSEPGDNVLVFDAALAERGALALAYRKADAGRIEGASPVHLRLVDAGGGIVRQIVSHEELGLGAPALIESGKPPTLWLSARATDSDILWGRVDADAHVEDFSLEAGLSERMVLTGAESALLVMEPDGLDLRFSTVICRP